MRCEHWVEIGPGTMSTCKREASMTRAAVYRDFKGTCATHYCDDHARDVRQRDAFRAKPALLVSVEWLEVRRSNPPLEALRHHVTGAIERGERQAIVEVNP